MTPKKIMIRGKKWTLKIQRPPSKNLLDGMCEYNERVIYVHPNASAGITATLIHEILHACLPDLKECCVLECESAIMDGINKMTSS
jgi:hypothetical protein